jgi:hypothetical protein
MGFWHTGYMDFHEHVGLEGHYPPEPTVYRCRLCGNDFPTPEELQVHRFESHPDERPLLFIRGLEIGTAPHRITRTLQADEVRASHFDHAHINGTRVIPSKLGKKLSQTTNERVTVELANEGVTARFDISFEIASDIDLAGVDSCFLAVARLRRLDLRAIEDFISAARAFPSGMGYCDGICEYLYGVLAKERAQDSSLAYEAYREKFNRAADLLRDFQRPIAQAIGALVAFHFNHFSESPAMVGKLRVGIAATRFERWLEGDVRGARAALSREYDDSLEKLLTDLETERIISWSIARLKIILPQLQDIESILQQDIPEFDRAKLRILLAEIYSVQGDALKAKRHARELLNNPTLGHWAEQLIERPNSEVSTNV